MPLDAFHRHASTTSLHVPSRISYYELLSRMGLWSDKLSEYTYRRLPPIYSRDFAYINNAPVVVRMARSNIGDVGAKSFAEYV